MAGTTGTLYLCEKPSQARDIARILGAKNKNRHQISGSGVTVTWCFGHLLEMAMPEDYGAQYKAWTMDSLPIVPETWRHNVPSDKKSQYQAVERLLKAANDLVIATDSDREGELLARELMDRAGYSGSIRRCWLSALNDPSIRHALDNLRDGDETVGLYHAGLARSRGDWLVGMNLTRAYTVMARQQGHDRLLPVGRVQNPALRIAVDRDHEIESFTPVPYWQIVLDVEDQQGAPFKATWRPVSDVDDQGRCIKQSSALNVAQQVPGATGVVTESECERKAKAPPLLYELGELQQAGERILNLEPTDVDAVLQALYEKHKAITYPRTECPYLPTNMQDEIDVVLKAIEASEPAWAARIAEANTTRRTKIWNNKEVDKESHHAVIPTTTDCDTAAMSEVERQFYDMICTRYIAQFYPDQLLDQAVLDIEVNGESFRAKGQTEVAPGWRVLLPAKAGKDRRDTETLPRLAQHDPVCVADVDVRDKKTQPPARFTPTSLIAAMKNAASLVTDPRLKKVLRATTGIGTKGTRSSTVKTLVNRGLLKRQNGKVISTDAGRALIEILPRAITNPATTALWEQALDDVANGRMTTDHFVGKQIQWIEAALKQLQAQGLNLSRMPAPAPQKSCPECGRPMRKRKSQHGPFWGCTGYPDCAATVAIGNKRRRKPAADSRAN